MAYKQFEYMWMSAKFAHKFNYCLCYHAVHVEKCDFSENRVLHFSRTIR